MAWDHEREPSTASQPSSAKPSTLNTPKKFAKSDAVDLLTRFIAARFQFAPHDPAAQEAWLAEACRQLSWCFASEIDTAATVLIGSSATWPTFAEIKAQVKEMRPAVGGLKRFVDRTPEKDNSPEGIARREAFCAEMRRRFPSLFMPSKHNGWGGEIAPDTGKSKWETTTDADGNFVYVNAESDLSPGLRAKYGKVPLTQPECDDLAGSVSEPEA